MDNLRTYGTCVGTHGAPGFQSSINSTIKTAFRMLAVGVIVAGAFASFAKTADANVALFGPGDPEGHYLGFTEGNSSGDESEAAILSILAQPINPIDHPNIIENQLTFYAKVDNGTGGTSSPGSDSPLGSLTTTFTGASSGTWSFSPLNNLQEVTLLAIKAGNYFGLWLYQQFTQGQDPQTGTFADSTGEGSGPTTSGGVMTCVCGACWVCFLVSMSNLGVGVAFSTTWPICHGKPVQL